MFTRTVTAALALGFLAAGAFAVTPPAPPSIDKPANVTVVIKNQAWPIKGNITLDPCSTTVCQEI